MIPEARTVQEKTDTCTCIKIKKSGMKKKKKSGMTPKVSTYAAKRMRHKLKEDTRDSDKSFRQIPEEFLPINRKRTNHPEQKNSEWGQRTEKAIYKRN